MQLLSDEGNHNRAGSLLFDELGRLSPVGTACQTSWQTIYILQVTLSARR